MDQIPIGADTSLPPEVLTALQRGETIEAIKRLREARGIGLKEAKDLLDAHASGGMVPGAAPDSGLQAQIQAPLPADVADAIRRGDKFEAIKLLRAHNGMGLAEAKKALEQQQEKQVLRDLPAPGAVPANGKFAWLFVAVLLALIAWLFIFPKN